jgi:hypothetical protein
VYDSQAQVFIRLLRASSPPSLEESNTRVLRAYKLHMGELSEEQIHDSVFDINGYKRLEYYKVRTQLHTDSISCENTFIMIGVPFSINDNDCNCIDCRQNF